MKKLIILFLSLFCVVIPLRSAFAHQISSEDTGAEYSVIPHWPEQKTTQSGYFDLQVTPGQLEELGLTIHNMGKETHVYQISVHTAATNKNKIVDYTFDNFVRDPSLKISLKDLVQPPSQEVSVGAGESRDITLHLQVPKETFSGILLGGVTVQPKEEKNGESELQSLFMHTVALRLQEGKDVSAKLTAGKAKLIKSDLNEQIDLAMRNPVGKLMTNISGKLELKNRSTGKILQSEELSDLSFAPNSCFDMPLILEKGLPAGKYSYLIHLKNRDGKFNFTRNFKVSTQDAVVEKKSYLWLFLLIIVVAAILIVITYQMKKPKKS